MGYTQMFSGVLELPTEQSLKDWYEEVVEDDDDQMVADHILETVVAKRIINLDIVSHQPATLWHVWNVHLATLTEYAIRGYVVDAFYMDGEIEFNVFGTDPNPARATPRKTENEWFPMEDVWKFGPGEEDALWIVEEEDGKFSIREFESDPFNETFATRFLRIDGSAILDADADDQLWLDGEWEEGDATLTNGEGSELLSIQQCLGEEVYELDGESVPAKRFSIQPRTVSTFAGSYSEPEIKRDPVVEILVAKGLGIVEIGGEPDDFVGLPSSVTDEVKKSTPKKWWEFWKS